MLATHIAMRAAERYAADVAANAVARPRLNFATSACQRPTQRELEVLPRGKGSQENRPTGPKMRPALATISCRQ